MAQKIIDKVTGKDQQATKLGNTATGEILIADDVVAMIAALAAMETDGVVSVGNTTTSEIMSKVGVHDKTHGVKVEIVGGIVRVSMVITVKNGYSIPGISQNVQAKVKSSVETMTGMNVKSVNVRVIGVEI